MASVPSHTRRDCHKPCVAPVSTLVWPRLAGFHSASGRGRAETLFLPEWLLRLLKRVKARQPHIRQIAFTETL